jgi:hypothetical protein
MISKNSNSVSRKMLSNLSFAESRTEEKQRTRNLIEMSLERENRRRTWITRIIFVRSISSSSKNQLFSHFLLKNFAYQALIPVDLREQKQYAAGCDRW